MVCQRPSHRAVRRAAKLALHLLTASRYGYFGDELYHMACGEHLAWGYVDQPPLIALLAWLTRHSLGISLFAIHFLPAIAGAALVCLTGLITRELGGGRFARALAGLSVACAGIFLIIGHLFAMNAFEPLFWMGSTYLVIRIVKTEACKHLAHHQKLGLMPCATVTQ